MAERHDGELREFGGAGCRQRLSVGPLAGLGLDSCVDIDRLVLEVDVRPPDREYLADARAVASIRSMMSAMSGEALGPGRSAVIHACTAVRTVFSWAILSARGSVFGRLMLSDPLTGFDGKAPASTATSSIAPVTTLALRWRFALWAPRSTRSALIRSVVSSWRSMLPRRGRRGCRARARTR
jgi:hypothetical protein